MSANSRIHGLTDGDLVCVSQLDVFVDGMRVQPQRDEAAGELLGGS